MRGKMSKDSTSPWSAPTTRPAVGTDAWMQSLLASAGEKGTLRTLVLPDTQSASPLPAISFVSNDYLCLARHPKLRERALAFMEAYGAGSRASRLIGGNLPIHEALETKIAKTKGTEAALVFASGFQTNAQVLQTLFRHPNPLQSHRLDQGAQPIVLCDRLCHASIYQGLANTAAKVVRFQHNDMDHLKSLLQRYHDHAVCWIIVESVYSMDGDQAPLDTLIALKHRYGARLYVDEAHATGVLGHHGYGLAADFPGSIDIVMGTFGKALGGYGAYCAISLLIRDFLINFCPGFIFTTALPPAVIGAADAAWDLVPSLDTARQHLQALANYARNKLEALRPGATLQSTTQIIPWVEGEAVATVALSRHLKSRGIDARAIRPPTVPQGACRLRIALNANHTPSDIDRLTTALADNRALMDTPVHA